MEFFLNIIPPTCTAQERKVTVRNGRPVFYEGAKLKAARNLFVMALSQYKPAKPMDGPLSLSVEWHFQSRSHKEGSYRVTRPDTDNLEKLLKDTMTQTGFWHDDSQVCKESVVKRWSREQPGILIKVVSLDAE